MPTFAPDLARAKAKFTAVVLLPTPPLQEATAMIERILSSVLVEGVVGDGGWAERATVALPMKGRDSAMEAQSDWNTCFIGQAGVVS